MLYLVATPIGNLKDITFRAIETLQLSDYILCEDTRHSLILLKHYQVQKPLISFHKFSEATKEDQIVDDLKSGKKISLITDAGTPGISDPGTRLVKRCIEENIEVYSIPGACAAVVALAQSGFDTDRFQFYGFLPKASGALKNALTEILNQPLTTICYESPERIQKVLEAIQILDPERLVIIARELTKKFEEMLRGTPTDILKMQQEKKFKGEIVLLISGCTKKSSDWEKFSIEEHVLNIQEDMQLSLNDAIKKVAQLRDIPKRTVYNKIHQDKKNFFFDF